MTSTPCSSSCGRPAPQSTMRCPRPATAASGMRLTRRATASSCGSRARCRNAEPRHAAPPPARMSAPTPRARRPGMIDPQRRWSRHADGKPDYAGLLTFAGLPYTEDLADLAGVDAAIIGAPMDELVTDRPGTRFGPRAIRAAGAPHGVHLEAGIDAFEELRVVDYGDAACVPADPESSHAAITALVAEVASAGVMPVLLGGDHSRYVQIGLRGYWPGEQEFAWQRERGITSFFAHDVRDRGIKEIVERAVAIVGPGPVLLTVDVDVLDPAFAPGTGTPEPGGMTPTELLWACRSLASRLDLVGSDVVEVLPTMVGGADITALVVYRVIRESLTGVALRRRAAREQGV